MILICIKQLKMQILVRQGNELAVIMRKRNSTGLKLISTSTAIVDIKNQFSNFYLFWEKELVTNTEDI